MRRMNYLLLILLLIFPFRLLPALDRLDVEFTPPRVLKNSSRLPLELTVSNFSGVQISGIFVQYRQAGDIRFKSERLNADGFQYSATLNLEDISSGFVEYFFDIQYADASHTIYPGNAPERGLFRTAVQQTRNYGDEIVIISPDPDEQIYSNDVVISVSFTRMAPVVDVAKTKMYLDTWDLSRYLEKFEDFVAFAPHQVPLGKHTIRVELYDSRSQLVASREWSFTALQGYMATASPNRLNVSGGIFGEFRREDLRDGASVNDYNYGGIQLKAIRSNFSFGARLYLSNQDKSDRQPVNRYTGYLQYDFWNHRYLYLSAGDAYPRFSPLLLQNILVRGFEGRLALKFINIDFVNGQSRRAVEGHEYTLINRFTNEEETQVIRGTYRRNLTALRTSFGEGRNLQVGFSFLKATDDSGSIRYGRDPQQNVVAGSDIHVSLHNDRVLLDASINASAYNRDITGGSLPFDSLQNIVGGLGSVEENYYNQLKNLITVNQNMVLRPALAYNGRLMLRYFNNNLSFMYESVDEGYHSLGQPYLLTDNRGIHIIDNVQLFKNQFFLTLGFRDFQNNLQKTRRHTTSNQNIYINFSYFPLKNLPDLTIGFNNYTRGNGLSRADSLLTEFPEDNRTNSFNITTGYGFNLLSLKHRVGFSLMNYQRTDNITKTGQSSSNYFRLNLQTRYQFPLQTNLEVFYQQTQTGNNTSLESNLDVLNLGVGAQYVFRNVLTEDRFMIKTFARFGSLTSKYAVTLVPQMDYTRNYFSLRLNYALPKYGSISLTGDLLLYQGDRSYRDYIYAARYEVNF